VAAHARVNARIRGIVLAVVASLAVSLLGAPALADSRTPPVPRLLWTTCEAGFQCATAKVPLDYDQPHGPKISLALIRMPATDRAHKLGSIFLNPGGPGGSGVDFVRVLGPSLFSAQVRARFDLVGFDPRGIARSTPLQCFDTLQDALAVVPTFAFPVTTNEEHVWVESDRTVATACARRAGPILDHMATADVARDLDLLRQAVGDAKLTYYGISYGSYLGATYANLFPGKVRALTVDGVLDPVAWTTGRRGEAHKLPFSTRLRADQGALATLRQFFNLCDQGGAACAFSAGNPRQRFDRLAERLREQPAQLPDGQGGTAPFRYSDLIVVTLGAMYEAGSWPFLADLLQELDTLTSAPATAAAATKAATGARRLRARLGALAEPTYENLVEGAAGVFCSETDNPSKVKAWSRAGAAADRRGNYFGRPWTWLSSVCQPWPGEDADRYDSPFDHATANPVLVIGNRYDPATRYQGAVTLDRLLPRSRLLTLDGWGHTALFLSACIDAHLNRYLLTGQVPARGTVCEPDVVPFASRAASALKTSAPSKRVAVIPPRLRTALGG
jgi:pimeloyl-ACP methyl ester carboxylesterase